MDSTVPVPVASIAPGEETGRGGGGGKAARGGETSDQRAHSTLQCILEDMAIHWVSTVIILDQISISIPINCSEGVESSFI